MTQRRGVERIGCRARERVASRRRRDPLDQPRELHRREGPGRHGHRGHRRGPGPRARARAGRSRRRSSIAPGDDVRARRHRRLGRDPTHLAHTRPAAGATRSCACTGTTTRSPRSSARSATSSRAAGASSRRCRRSPVCVNPGSAFNCYWEMPFQRRARITLTNESETRAARLLPDHLLALRRARRRRAILRAVPPRQPAAAQATSCTILDGVRGRGQYVGTYCAWGVNNSGWWGEGELKFFIDGDDEFPTICGTGTEDYFCGSYNFDVGGQLHRVHDAVRRHAAGAPPRRRLPVAAALRPLPLAPHRPDPVPDRPARHHAGARLAIAAAATCNSRTTSRRSRSGTRRFPSRRIPSCPTATRARSSDATTTREALVALRGDVVALLDVGRGSRAAA